MAEKKRAAAKRRKPSRRAKVDARSNKLLRQVFNDEVAAIGLPIVPIIALTNFSPACAGAKAALERRGASWAIW